MKDYFAAIIEGVTGVTRGDRTGNSRKAIASDRMEVVTPGDDGRGDRGDTKPELSPPGTPEDLKGVTQNPRKTGPAPLSPLVTPYNDEYSNIKVLYDERAGILEYDSDLPREEAELLSYQFSLIEFISRHHPEIKVEFDKIILKPIQH